MNLIGDALRAASANQRPLLVVADRRAAVKLASERLDRKLLDVLLDPCGEFLIESLVEEAQSLSDAARKERLRRRRERAELRAEIRGARA